jgi:tripartite-type tricarboxylate transporter receptor subunit TctC
VSEFIAYARANPAKVSMASAGSGDATHLGGELFKVMTDISMMHVPYRGGAPAISDLLGGQVQVYFGSFSLVIEHIRAGKLRALAVTTPTRVGEFVPGYVASQWFAIGLRKNTPAEIIGRLNKEVDAVLTDAKIQARLADLGTTMRRGSVADLGTFIVDETEKWAKVVKFANIKPE